MVATPRADAANRAVRIALGLGLGMSLPALAVGFSNDDLLQRLELEGKIAGYERPWLTLYDFTPPGRTMAELTDWGYLPWFSAPDLSLRFFRPLSSALLSVDHALFGRNALAAHVHSLAWFALLVGLTAALYRRWFSRAIATWAAVIYATAGLHAMSTAWLAARHSMVSAAFAVLALWSHARTREDGWRAGPLLTVLALVAGICAGETTLGAFALLAAYELMRPVSPAQPATVQEPARQPLAWAARIKGAGVFAGAAIAYLGLYALAGYGAHHSGMYVSPLAEPAKFAALAPIRVALLAGQLFAAVPSELPTIVPAATLPLAAIGLLAFAATFLVLWRLRELLDAPERRHLVWLGGGGLSSLLPMASTMPGGRLLPLALVGTAPLVGSALVLLSRVVPRWRAVPVLGALGLMHLVLSPTWRVIQTLTFAHFGRTQKALAERAELQRCASGGVGYLLTGADPSLSLYAGPAILFHTPRKVWGRLFLVSAAPQDQRVTRIGPRTIEVDVLGDRTSNEFEHLYSDRGLAAGDGAQLDGLGARVLAAENGLFTRARFELASDPDQGASCLLAWRGAKLVAIQPPGLGQSVVVRHELGPMGL